MSERKVVDPYGTTSDKKGLLGFIEATLRKVPMLSQVIVMIIIAFSYVIALTLSLTPTGYIITTMYDYTHNMQPLVHYFALGASIGLGYIAYGLTLIIVVPAINFLLPLKLKPFRGPYHSLEVIPWYTHNALCQLVRYTFLDLITPTPLNILYFRLMGMKIGKGVMINTSNISDPGLITLGDYVTIGGSVTMFAHYGQKNFLVIEPLVIKKKAVIGLKASLFGDVVIGEKCLVGAHQVVLPKTRLADGEKLVQK